MKVLEKTEMPNGTSIQLEDWHMHNSEKHPNLYGYTIGAYPIAKNETRIIRKNKTFRLTICSNNYSGYTDEMVLEDYFKLKNGEIVLEDLKGRYYDGKKAEFLMGLSDSFPNW